MSAAVAKEIIDRRDGLKSLRQPHESVWRDCFDHTHPMRGSGLEGDLLDAVQAANRNAKLLDSTAADAARTLTSTMCGGIHPSNSIWFGLNVGRESDDEQRWLDDRARQMWEDIHASNFDAVSFECILDGVEAGWFVMYIDEAKSGGGYHFEQWAISQCHIAASTAGGAIDTVYRTYRLSAQQAVSEFGEGGVHETVAKLAKEKPAEMIEFVHAIEPRSTYVVGAKLAKNMRFRSCHVDTKNQHVCRESGYHEFPCVVPRWHKIPDSHYAVGPVYDALPDIRMLNEVKRLELAAADIAIGGMWIAEDDGVLNARTIKLGPRKVVVANSTDSLKPLTSGSNFNISFTIAADLQRAIMRTLMADQLGPQDGPTKTATEIHARVGLIRQMLGPVYGRFQAEYLQPLIERCFGIAYRAGAFPPPPASLANRDFTVKFLSPMARSQRLEEVAAIDQYVAGTAAIAQSTGDLSIFDTVDLVEAQAFKAQALGVPSQCIPDKRTIEKIRRTRAQQQRAAQQQAQGEQLQQVAVETALKRPAA